MCHCEKALPAWIPESSLRATGGVVAWIKKSAVCHSRAILLRGSKINKNPSWRSHEVAVAIQTIPNIMRDLIRILNKFSIKIYLYLDGHGAKRRLTMTVWVFTQQDLPAQAGI